MIAAIRWKFSVIASFEKSLAVPQIFIECNYCISRIKTSAHVNRSAVFRWLLLRRTTKGLFSLSISLQPRRILILIILQCIQQCKFSLLGKAATAGGGGGRGLLIIALSNSSKHAFLCFLTVAVQSFSTKKRSPENQWLFCLWCMEHSRFCKFNSL